MAGNPWDGAPIVVPKGAGFFIPPAAPKASPGFATVGTPAAQTRQTYIPGSKEDPAFMAAQAAAEARARAAASTPIEVAGQIQAAQARAGIETAAHATQLRQDMQMGPKMTAEERSKAIAGYKTADQLAQIVADLKNQYKAGPGATKGIRGLADYLPRTVNQQFDNAGNAARGIVGTALGFTGGQLNTPQEAAASVGPYIPHANDRDEVILDKIRRLEQLSHNARDRSIEQLGGVPDADGNIISRDQARKMGLLPAASADPTPPAAPGGPPPMEIATGATHQAASDPTLRLVEGMIRQGMSADQINAVIVPAGLSQGVKKEDVERAQKALSLGGTVAATKEEPNTLFNKLSASGPGAYTIAAANALSGNNMDSLAGLAGGGSAEARAKMAALAEKRPGWDMAGGVSGSMLGAAGMEIGAGAAGARMGGNIASRILSSPRTADAAYGAFSGAGASDGDRLTGALTGGTTGILGGMFGRGLAQGASNAVGGVRNEAVRYLNDAGVPMTVGQVLGQSGRVGNALRTVENGMSSIPIVGDMIKARQREGFQGTARAAFDQGLAPIGATTNGVVGAEGVDAARAAVGNAYNTTLNPVRLPVDGQFLADEAGARMAANALPTDMATRGNYAIDRAGENFDLGAELPGSGLQQAIRRFRRTTSENAPLPNGADLGDVMNQAEGAYTGLVGRQAPDVMPQLQAANAANRNVSILKDAVNRARNGTRTGETDLFSPSQLSDAAAANARKFGGTQGTTQQPFFDLTRAAQQVLPSTVPDSGTAGRLASLALPALAGGAGASGGYAMGDAGEGTKYGLAAGALAALGGSRSAQRLMTRALLDRPDWAEELSRQLAQRSRYTGMAFSGVGSALTPALAPSQ